MLEGVVEQYYVDGAFLAVVLGQLLYASCALLVDGNRYLWKFLLHLVSLVANHRHGRILPGNEEAPALPLVAPTEHGHSRLVFQQADKVFHMRCLSSATDGDVADGDDGCLIGTAFQDS